MAATRQLHRQDHPVGDFDLYAGTKTESEEEMTAQDHIAKAIDTLSQMVAELTSRLDDARRTISVNSDQIKNYYEREGKLMKEVAELKVKLESKP